MASRLSTRCGKPNTGGGARIGGHAYLSNHRLKPPKLKLTPGQLIGLNLLVLVVLATICLSGFGLVWLAFPAMLLSTLSGGISASRAGESLGPHLLSVLLVLLIGGGTCGLMGGIHGR